VQKGKRGKEKKETDLKNTKKWKNKTEIEN
jgi:hypothetical protein